MEPFGEVPVDERLESVLHERLPHLVKLRENDGEELLRSEGR